jgi:hypothetical protein
MYFNDYELHRTAKRRMQEDQRQAAWENMVLSSRPHFNLFFWTQRVRDIFANLEHAADGKASGEGKSSVILNRDREAHGFSQSGIGE